MKYYAKAVDDPTMYFVDDDGNITKVAGIPEMYRIGILPVRVMSVAELNELLTQELNVDDVDDDDIDTDIDFLPDDEDEG